MSSFTVMKVFVPFSLLLLTIYAQSNTLDNFIMNEAHIGEFRAREDDNSGYPPFYLTCPQDPHDSDKIDFQSCTPGMPIIYERFGITAITSSPTSRAYYGCPRNQSSDTFGIPDIFNEKERHKLFMKRAKRAHFIENISYQTHYITYVNIYKFNCKEKLSPIMWRIPMRQQGHIIQYDLGFEIEGYGKLPLAGVLYDYLNYIPIRTKHIVYGKSLTSPIAAFDAIEDLNYGYDINDLSYPFKSYYKFNSDLHPLRSTFNKYLEDNGLSLLKGDLVMAHLIPEYDIVQASWKGIANFAHTIAPMWKDLYTGIWADIENAIREAAFLGDSNLKVYTGTHGTLTFNTDDLIKFFLHGRVIPIPEMIWKLVMDERHSKSSNKKAIAIILYNMTEEMTGANTFKEFQPPCVSRCTQLQWLSNNPPNIFCCAVQDVKDIITGFPNKARTEAFDLLIKGSR